MDVLITWICLGGGVVMIILSMVIISRVQARTRGVAASRPEPGRDN
jgi:hypothetical protein